MSKKFSVWVATSPFPYSGLLIGQGLSWGKARKMQLRQDKRDWIGINNRVVVVTIQDAQSRIVHSRNHRGK